ncbi:hypothetical protein PV327_011211, partial [Microctonus hyperodae]
MNFLEGVSLATGVANGVVTSDKTRSVRVLKCAEIDVLDDIKTEEFCKVFGTDYINGKSISVTEAAMKSSSEKIFLSIGHIPEVLKPAIAFLTVATTCHAYKRITLSMVQKIRDLKIAFCGYCVVER